MNKIKFFTVLILLLAVSVNSYGQEMYLKKDKKGKYGIVDQNGKIVKPYKYGSLNYVRIDDFSKEVDGLAKVRIGNYPNDKCGFIDETYKFVVPPRYNTIKVYDFLIEASIGYNEDDYFDTDGNKLKYEKIYILLSKDGLAQAKYNDKWGLIDVNIKEVIPLKYEWISHFSEGLASVTLDGKKGFIDKNDNVIIPLKYDGAGSFSEGVAEVKLGDKWGLIDKTGKEVVPPKYDNMYSFEGEFAQVKLGDKYGLIDKTGQEIVSPKYEFLWEFEEKNKEWAKVKLDDKYGFIDRTGKEVVPPKYNFIEFKNDEIIGGKIIEVSIGKSPDIEYKYIDIETGKEVFNEYSRLYNFSKYERGVNDKGIIIDGVAIAEKGKNEGCIDLNTGEELIPLKNNPWAIRYYLDGVAVIIEGEKFGIVDKYGREVVPCVHSTMAEAKAKAQTIASFIIANGTNELTAQQIEMFRSEAISEVQIKELERQIAEMVKQNAEAAERQRLEQQRLQEQQRQQERIQAIQQGFQNAQQIIQNTQTQMQLQNIQTNQQMNNLQRQTNTNTNTQSRPTGSTSSSQSETPRPTCSMCNGEGKVDTEVATFGLGEPKWCDKCKKDMPAGHCHGCKVCPACGGKGYL